MRRIKPYKSRRDTLLDNRRMLDFMAMASDKHQPEFLSNIPAAPKPRVKSEATSEADVNADIRAWCKQQPLISLFRNNVGSVELHDGGRIMYGVGGAGAADWIGYKTVLVTADMVGKHIAIFTAVEAKRPGAYARGDQQEFLKRITDAGGIAGVAHTAEELANIFGE